jgi:Kelch motif
MGTWTSLTNQAPFGAGQMLLLTDGRIMVQQGGSQRWWRLTPDKSGSYIDGSWSRLANMANNRTFFDTAVLADGRVFVAGGEYSDAGPDTDRGEIYDPLTDTWTSIGNPGWGQIGDAASSLLADGRVLVGNLTDSRTAIYDPATNTWTAAGNMAARSNEESWTLLPDGTVLTVSCANHPNAEKYIPSLNSWVTAGATPVELVQASSIEIGPAVLMPNGTVFCIGATGHTAIYSPADIPLAPGSWSAGPDFPLDSQGRLLKAKDAPACLLVNGNVLCVAGPCGDGANDFAMPTMFFEFDGTNLIRVSDPPNAGGLTYSGRLLALPNGQALFSADTIYVYTPSGDPDPSWKPVITSFPGQIEPGAVYTLQGTQLNGLSQGSMFGDDAQQAINYPLVRARRVADNSFRYWRTANHSSMGVATGSSIVSTQVTVPSISAGQYEVVVVANGIASDAALCEFPAITWSAPGTLTTVRSPISIAGHFSSGDQRHLVVVGTSTGKIHEIFWHPAQVGIEGEDDLPVKFKAGAIVSVGSMYDRDQQRHLVVVGTTAGKVHEIFWKPDTVGIEGEDDLPVNFTANSIVGVTGLYDTDQRRFIVVVGTKAGKVHEIFWKADTVGIEGHDDLPVTFPRGSIVAVTALYDSDQRRYIVVVGTKAGKLHEIYWKADTVGIEGHDDLPVDFGSGSIVAVSGFYDSNRQRYVIAVALADGTLRQVYWRAWTEGIEENGVIAKYGRNSIASLASFFSVPDNVNHIVVALHNGELQEFWTIPAS